MRDDWILTTAEVIEEQRWVSLSPVEKELEKLKRQKIEGKISNEPSNWSSLTYDDCLRWILDDAEDEGEITAEESEKLYKRYA